MPPRRNQNFKSASRCQDCGHDCGDSCKGTDIATTNDEQAIVQFTLPEKTRAYDHFYHNVTQTGNTSNQLSEPTYFDPKKDWEEFIKLCTPGTTVRVRFAILIGCLNAHYDRLAECGIALLEPHLVCWALSHMGSPMSDFLQWSLAREEGPPECWTIDILEEHLILWSNVFESGPAKYYEENVMRLNSSLHPNQSITNGPSIAHAFFSDSKHRRRAHQLWKVFWHKHFEFLAQSHQPDDAEMTDAP